MAAVVDTRTAALSWWSRRRYAWSDQDHRPLPVICGLTVSGTGRAGAMSGCLDTGSLAARVSVGSRTAGSVVSVAGSGEVASGIGTELLIPADEKNRPRKAGFSFPGGLPRRDQVHAQRGPLLRGRIAGRPAPKPLRGAPRSLSKRGALRGAPRSLSKRGASPPRGPSKRLSGRGPS
jgi:hypothetical protein